MAGSRPKVLRILCAEGEGFGNIPGLDGLAGVPGGDAPHRLTMLAVFTHMRAGGGKQIRRTQVEAPDARLLQYGQ
jgi:hypothetical protein